MGKFIGIIAAALDERDGEFVQTTELLEFPDLVWVYYCRPHLGAPRPGWTDLAADTLRVSLAPEPFRWDKLEWQPVITHNEAAGTFEYVSEVFGVEPGNNLFHLALPPAMLPVPDSWDVPPLYGHVDRNRFVMGWSISWNQERQDNQWPTFRFLPLSEEQFQARGKEIDRTVWRASRERRQQMLMPWQPQVEIDKVALLDKSSGKMSLEEVRTLVFELGADYDNLSGETKIGKLRELILFMEHQDQLPRLISHLRKRYPNVLDE